MGVEKFRKPLGNAGNADVPGDMPRQLAFAQAEIAEGFGYQRPVVITKEQKRRAPCGVIFLHRRRIFTSKK